MITVRPAAPSDARALAEARWHGEEAALRQSFPEGFPASWLDPGVEDLVSHWGGHLRNLGPRTAVFVAELDDEPVGGIEVGESDAGDGAGALRFLYLLPRAWGSGAASALHERGVEQLRADGFVDATLWVVDRNLRARAFYEKHGWTPAGETKTAGDGLPLVRYRRHL